MFRSISPEIYRLLTTKATSFQWAKLLTLYKKWLPCYFSVWLPLVQTKYKQRCTPLFFLCTSPPNMYTCNFHQRSFFILCQVCDYYCQGPLLLAFQALWNAIWELVPRECVCVYVCTHACVCTYMHACVLYAYTSVCVCEGAAGPGWETCYSDLVSVVAGVCLSARRASALRFRGGSLCQTDEMDFSWGIRLKRKHSCFQRRSKKYWWLAFHSHKLEGQSISLYASLSLSLLFLFTSLVWGLRLNAIPIGNAE